MLGDYIFCSKETKARIASYIYSRGFDEELPFSFYSVALRFLLKNRYEINYYEYFLKLLPTVKYHPQMIDVLTQSMMEIKLYNGTFHTFYRWFCRSYNHIVDILNDELNILRKSIMNFLNNSIEPFFKDYYIQLFIPYLNSSYIPLPIAVIDYLCNLELLQDDVDEDLFPVERALKLNYTKFQRCYSIYPTESNEAMLFLQKDVDATIFDESNRTFAFYLEGIKKIKKDADLPIQAMTIPEKYLNFFFGLHPRYGALLQNK